MSDLSPTTTVIATIFIIGLTIAHLLRLLPQITTTRPTTTMSQSATSTGKDEHGGYRPTPAEIVDLRALIVKHKELPLEIVDDIFDYAEYWASCSNEIDFVREHGDSMKVNGRSRVEDKFLLRSFPVGFTSLSGNKTLAEELAYDTNLPQPYPINREHEPSFFTEMAPFPTPSLANPVRKIVFNLRSRDQGSGGHRANKGTFAGSWTWFDAGLERFDASKGCNPQCVPDLRYTSRESQEPKLPLCTLRPIEPKLKQLTPEQQEARRQPGHGDLSPWDYDHPLHPKENLTVQKNRTSVRIFEHHTVVWRWDDDDVSDLESEAAKALEEVGRGRLSGNGDFVRSLKLGDVVTLWGKSRFPAWVNHIERVSIDVYWAV